MTKDAGLPIAARCLPLAGILPGQRYVVLAFFQMEKSSSYPPLPDEKTLIYILNGRMGIVTTLGRYSVILATCQDGDTEESLQIIADRIKTCYSEHSPVAVTLPLIGAGLEDLHAVIRHTMNDADYLYFWQKDQVGDDENAKTEALISFFKAMRNLVNRLDNQDYSGAKTIFDQIMEANLPRTAQDFQITKYRIYGMIEMLVAAISEGSSLGEDQISKLNFETKLYESETLQEFRRTVEQVFLTLIDIRQQCDSSNDGAAQKIEVIKAYVDEHFTDNNLTGTFVAERFNLSSSYLSREFKRSVGCNMLEYIQKLRVEQAKKLLSDYSVKEAAQMSGFWDTQGLVRVFKKYEGITPGEFKQSLS